MLCDGPVLSFHGNKCLTIKSIEIKKLKCEKHNIIFPLVFVVVTNCLSHSAAYIFIRYLEPILRTENKLLLFFFSRGRREQLFLFYNIASTETMNIPCKSMEEIVFLFFLAQKEQKVQITASHLISCLMLRYFHAPCSIEVALQCSQQMSVNYVAQLMATGAGRLKYKKKW